MSGVATAIGGAAVLGFVGSKLSSDSASNAAQKQTDAAMYASDLQKQEFDQQQANQQPWQQAGVQALSQLQDPSFQHSFNASDFQQDPGYQFNLQQGQQALERSAAAQGGLQTGGTLKSLTQYAQGMASNEYQNAYNRFTNDQSNRFNRLASVAGLGQTANGQMGQAGMNMANNIGQNAMGAANAQGAAGIAGANAWGSTLSSLGTSGGNMLMQNQMMNRFAMPGSYGGAGAVGLGSSMGQVNQPVAPYQSSTFGTLAGD